MRVGVGPGSREMYRLLGEQGEKAVEVAQTAERLFREHPSSSVTQDDVKELEHEADRIASDLLHCINAQFVTPFDRQDLVTLVYAVDEVPDKIENACEMLSLYGVESATRPSVELCGLLVKATTELASALGRLKSLRGSAAEIRAIKELEDEADQVARTARAGLFKDDGIDPRLVIRWKDMYEALEDAVDACDTAATRLGNLLVKHA